MIGKNVSMLGVVAGMLTLLMSLVGCAAANSQSRPALCCYMCVFAVAAAVQIAAAVGMVTFSNQLEINQSVPSGALTSYSQIQVQNAAFSLYQRCCTGCPTGQCNNPSPDSWVNTTLPNCMGTTRCTLMFPCSNSTQAKCFKYLPNEPVIIPPYPVDGSICAAMSALRTTNARGIAVFIVGPADQGGCGGGDPSAFLQNLDNYLSNSLNGVAIVFILAVLFESLILPAGLYLAISGGNRYGRAALMGGNGDEDGLQDDRDRDRDRKGGNQVDVI